MKIDAGICQQNLGKGKPSPDGSSVEPESGPKDGFSNRPHADYDTNLAKLRDAALRNPEQLKLPGAGYSEPISNQDVDQKGFQERLIADLGPQFARMQYTHDCSKLQGMIPTTGQLQAEFDKLAANKDVPFEYIYDGCYARAHIMCDQMNQDDVNNAKMFVMLKNPYGTGKLTAENKYMKAEWWYHVAPMVFAHNEESKQVEPFIMDPSMSKKPMKPQEWIHAMWDEGTKIKIDITRNPQYGPLETAAGANQTFEESMPSAIETCVEYTKEMEKIKQDYDATHPPQQGSGGGSGQRKAA